MTGLRVIVNSKHQDKILQANSNNSVASVSLQRVQTKTLLAFFLPPFVKILTGNRNSQPRL